MYNDYLMERASFGITGGFDDGEKDKLEWCAAHYNHVATLLSQILDLFFHQEHSQFVPTMHLVDVCLDYIPPFESTEQVVFRYLRIGIGANGLIALLSFILVILGGVYSGSGSWTSVAILLLGLMLMGASILITVGKHHFDRRPSK